MMSFEVSNLRTPRFADSRATVRMVPSTGFITALYAVSTPFVNAWANSSPVMTSFPTTALENPRNN